MKTMKGLLAIATLACCTQSAFAYWDTGVDTVNRSNPNDGEAMLTIWDADSHLSYSQDLGVRYSALFNGSAFDNRTIALDATALSIFSNSLNLDYLQWTVAAANSHVRNGAANRYTGAGYIFSYEKSVELTVPRGAIGANVNATWANFNPYQVNLAMANPADDAQVRSGMGERADGGSYQKNFIDFVDQQLDRHWDYLPGGTSTLNLWFTGFGNDAGTQGAVKLLGSATLDLNARTLTFNTPAVPVPASALLMGSALFGLGGVARSRRHKIDSQ